MSPNETVRSRRERPAKPALSRSWIIAETIRIARAEGLEKATMRRVAQALDTGPASLYVYVANTAELHAAVLDELITPITADPITSGTDEWHDRLETLLRAYSSVLLTYPGLARSALVLRPSGLGTIRLFDRILGLLLEGGIPVDRAAWGADLLVQQSTANAAEHSAPTSDDVHAPADEEALHNTLARAVRNTDPADTPHVAAHAEALLAGPPQARSSWAIQTLIAGIAATPIPTFAEDPSGPQPLGLHGHVKEKHHR